MIGRSRSLRRLAAVLLVAVACSGAGACSKDKGSDGAASVTSTTADGSSGSDTTAPGATTDPDDPTPTTEAGPTTQPGPATTVDPNAPPPQDFGGSFDGQDAGTSIAFTKSSDVSSVEVEGLVVACNPLEGNGDPSSTTIDLSFPKVPVAADGSVQLDLPDDPYQPTLSGIFTPEGTFAGNVYVSFEQKGLVCGGDYPFTAEPS